MRKERSAPQRVDAAALAVTYLLRSQRRGREFEPPAVHHFPSAIYQFLQRLLYPRVLRVVVCATHERTAVFIDTRFQDCGETAKRPIQQATPGLRGVPTHDLGICLSGDDLGDVRAGNTQPTQSSTAGASPNIICIQPDRGHDGRRPPICLGYLIPRALALQQQA